MEIIVTNRADIQAGIQVNVPYVVISIHDTDRVAAKIPGDGNLRGVLAVGFDDGKHAIGTGSSQEFHPMTATQAVAVRDFVLLHREQVGAIVVHCEQGMCRSPAMAAGIAESLGVDHVRFLKEYSPNWDVYFSILEAFEALAEERER